MLLCSTVQAYPGQSQLNNLGTADKQNLAYFCWSNFYWQWRRLHGRANFDNPARSTRPLFVASERLICGSRQTEPLPSPPLPLWWCLASHPARHIECDRRRPAAACRRAAATAAATRGPATRAGRRRPPSARRPPTSPSSAPRRTARGSAPSTPAVSLDHAGRDHVPSHVWTRALSCGIKCWCCFGAASGATSCLHQTCTFDALHT